MKKLAAALAIGLFVIGGLCVWLLGQAGPDNANSETVTIELPDNFEK